MSYLIEHYWMGSLACLCCGGAAGYWWFPRLYRVLALMTFAVAAGLIAAVLGWLPEPAGLDLGSALLLLLALVLGAMIGGWLRCSIVVPDASEADSRVASSGDSSQSKNRSVAAIAAEVKAADDAGRAAEAKVAEAAREVAAKAAEEADRAAEAKAAEDARRVAAQAAEDARRAAEAKAAEDAREAAAAQAAEDARRAALAKAAEEAREAAAVQAAEDERRAEEVKASEEARQAAAAQAAEEARRAAEVKAAEDAREAAAAQAAEEARRAAEVTAAEEAREAAAAQAAEEARRAAEVKAAEDAQEAAAAQAAEEARRAAEVKVAEDAREAAAMQAAEDARPAAEDAGPAAEAKVPVDAGEDVAADGALHPGVKPVGIAEPRDGKADNLKLIKGIGPGNEGICHDLGIYHLAQIADWSADEATWVGHHMGFPGRLEREHWIEQAGLLVAGGDTLHSAGVKAGTIQLDSRADAPLNEADVAALSAGMPAQAASVEGETAHEGRRPHGLLSPLQGRADDLKRIRGIGPQNERRLHALGIWHFDQIAAWSAENVAWVGSYLAFPGRIDREQWIAQAKDLAANRNSPTPPPTSTRKRRK